MKNEARAAGVEDRPAGIEEYAPPRVGDVKDGATGERAHAAPKATGHGVLREYFESLVVTAIMALFGMTFIVQAVKVPTGSMQNTILIGDHLLVNKFVFAPGPPLPFLPMREIRRGDIIVFKYPGKYPTEQFQRHVEVDDTMPGNVPFETNYVKRVVGLPGERVELRDTQVFINGQPLDERIVAAHQPPPDDPATPYTNENDAPLEVEDDPQPSGSGPYAVYWSPRVIKGEVRLGGAETEFDVPEGHYLVLGDNRENSQDSRYWGYVPRELIVGRAMFVYWSYDESAPAGDNFLVNFFRNTRWSRTGTLVR